MPKILTDEEIEIYVVDNKYKLLNIYREDKIKIEVQCPNNHMYITTWTNFRAGKRCKQCRINNTKLSYEYVKNYIEIESKSGCTLLSNFYINNNTLLKVKCKCTKEFEVTFGNFQRGTQQCRECGIKLRSDQSRLTYEEVKNYIESFNGYKLLSTEYFKNNIKLDIMCPNGHIFKMSYADFKSGHRCSVCAGRQKSIEDIYKIINIEDYQLLTILTKVPKNIEKLEIKCPNNHIFKMSYGAFQQGGRCGECNGHFRHKDTDYFKNEVYNLVGEEYEVLEEYNKSTIKIKIRHNTCGYEWDITPDGFLSGSRCPKCQHQSYKKTTEEFKDEVFNLVGNEYIVLGEYKKNDINIKMFHEKCGKEFNMRPGNFLYGGNRCPHCNQSRGERKIENYCSIKNVIFSQQYRINECRNKRSLPFDFAMFWDKEKTQLRMLIEYDGEQHFKDKTFYGGEDRYLYLKHNDNIKNQYCKNNNIKLIRIPYWDFDNIEEILKRELMI